MKIYALIVAAGNGKRLGSAIPKQYLKINSKPILRHVLEKFLSHKKVDGVLTVISNKHIELYKKATEGLNLLPYTFGGNNRQESVKLGLEALKPYNPDYVLIHDAARPNLSKMLITKVIDELTKFDAIELKVNIKDTIKNINDLNEDIDRDNFFQSQTPQGFKFDLILEMHRKYKDQDYSDDIKLAIKGNLSLGIIDGEQKNFKITTLEDLKMARLLNSQKVLRVGNGFDVHELINTDEDVSIPICGVLIKAKQYVVAHSDGDVGLHALMDAILGALALGDIGEHFPPSDDKWKNADSKDMLKYIRILSDNMGAEICNIDITIICETPKIKLQKKQMVTCISKILELNENQVNVKATTTEKLGFIGRSEGIAAQAICLINL